jgi:hypothetical protein
MNARQQILHFKIQLRDIKPAIWRRIEVPASYTFWDLHVAIQDAMGWLDSHLHAFRIRPPRMRAEVTIGIPDPEPFEGAPDFLPGWRIPVTQYFTDIGHRAQYEYDFGDGWEHDLVLEQVSTRLAKTKYPRCVAGARACPPEDCGGPGGYAQLLETIANPADPEHESMLEWLGGPFEAEAFDPRDIRFDNPKKRWQIAFTDG